ncbi:unnamed protein product [Orchesella dallaii]|uniref:Secreted protein n=1 Tax=Orchesella dallaii TaxID=48710 RepID=A0ABP1RT96_9HEXA
MVLQMVRVLQQLAQPALVWGQGKCSWCVSREKESCRLNWQQCQNETFMVIGPIVHAHVQDRIGGGEQEGMTDDGQVTQQQLGDHLVFKATGCINATSLHRVQTRLDQCTLKFIIG